MITPNGPRRLTWGEVLNEATDWPRPDARFAQDLAAVRGDQGELAEDAWGSLPDTSVLIAGTGPWPVVE